MDWSRSCVQRSLAKAEESITPFNYHARAMRNVSETVVTFAEILPPLFMCVHRIKRREKRSLANATSIVSHLRQGYRRD